MFFKSLEGFYTTLTILKTPMDGPPPKEKLYLMKLTPLKPRDRYQHIISYDFELRHPKRSEGLIDLPIMNFSEPSHLPVFMAPYEKSFHIRNPNYFYDNFCHRLERGNEEELKLLMLPKPPKKSRYCGVCYTQYEEYYSHVTSETHKNAFKKHTCLQLLYRERDEIHSSFLESREEYINAVPSPTGSPSRKDERDIENKSGSDDEQNNSNEEKDREYKDGNEQGLIIKPKLEALEESSKENLDLQTARKEAHQNKKNTKKRTCTKPSLMKPKPIFEANHSIQSSSHPCGVLKKEGIANNSEEDNSHIKEKIQVLNDKERSCSINSGLINQKSPHEEEKKIEVVYKSETNRTLNSEPLKLDIVYKYASKYEPWEPIKLDTTKNQPAQVISIKETTNNEEVEPKKSCKRAYPIFSEIDQEEMLSMFKKVKISDMSNSQKNKPEPIRVDLRDLPKGPWQNLKTSFVDLIDGLKGTVSSFYGLWKK